MRLRFHLPALLSAATIAVAPAQAWAQDPPPPPPPGDAAPADPGPDEEPPPPPEPVEVVVTGSRVQQRLSDAPVATEVISRDAIERSGAEDLGEILEEHPGVQIERDAFSGQSIRIQGLDSKYVLVLIDGERTVGRNRQRNDLSRITAEVIDHIEIVRGPSSALYGADAVGGVINVITRRPRNPFEARARASYGMRNTLDLAGHVGFRQGAWDGRFNAGWHRGDAYDLDPSTPSTNGSSYSAVNVAGATRYRPSKDVRLNLAAGYTIRNENAIDENQGGAVFDREQLVEIFDVLAGSRMRLAQNSDLRIDGHFTLQRFQRFSDQRRSDALDQYEDTQEQRPNIRVQYDQRLFQDHLVSVGMNAFHQSLESELRLPNGRGERNGMGIYLQDEWTALFNPYLVLVPGVRVDLDSQYGVHPTPKLALRYDPHPRVKVRAAYGWGFRAPDFEELLLRFENPTVGYIVQGNPDLDPETSRAVNASVETRPVDMLWASLNLFRNDVSGLIQTQTLDDGTSGRQVFEYINVAEAWTMGLESVVRLKPHRMIQLEAGYTLTASRDVDLDRPLAGVAAHRGTADVRFHHQSEGIWGLQATVRGRLVGERPFYADDDGDGLEERIDADPYVTLDARVAVDLFQQHLGLFVGGDNLIDAGESRFLPIPPLTIYGGLVGRYPAAKKR